MEIVPERVGESYKAYESAANMWGNINSENINTNSNLMYNLYKTLQAKKLVTSLSTFEEKKNEITDRFVDLGEFMFETDSIKILSAANNRAYTFLRVENNPLMLTEKECEKVFQVDDNESLLETKARTVDVENKIAKMCTAQIMRIVEPDAKSKANDEEAVKSEIIKKVIGYSVLLNRLQSLKRAETPELEEKNGIYTEDGYFNMPKFLEIANKTNIEGNPLEFKNTYGKVIDKIVNETPEDPNRASLEGFDYDINDFGKFAIAKKLMCKLYEYKEADLYDLIVEYEMIKGTKAESNVLITTNKEAKLMNKKIDRVLHVAIKGYNQPFSVHVRDESFKQYEEKFGEIPGNVLAPVARRSKVTRKLQGDAKAIISSVYKQDQGTKTIQYLEYLEDLQNIDDCREEIRYKKKKEQELKEEKEQAEQKERQKIISKVNKDIRKFTSKISQLESKKRDIHNKVRKTPKTKPGKFDGRKIINKESQQGNRDFAMKQIQEAERLERKLAEYKEQKAELEAQLKSLLKDKEQTKDN